ERMVTTHPYRSRQPFVLHNSRLYFERYFAYETLLLERLREFILVEKALEAGRFRALRKESDFIRKLFLQSQSDESNKQTNWQLAAAVTAVINNFTIITGGPGTGKTTTVAKILSILFKITPDLRVALAAPTGKAAARMAESLKATSVNFDSEIVNKIQALEPSTLHRLLKSVKDTPHFKHNRKNPLNFNVVIIDESSMIGVALFAKLLDAI